MFNHELLKKNYESGINTHRALVRTQRALVHTQKKVCKFEKTLGEVLDQNTVLLQRSKRTDTLLEAILKVVSGGSNSEINLLLANHGATDAPAPPPPPTTATIPQINHAHDDDDDDDDDVDAMELDMGDETVTLGWRRKETDRDDVEIVSIVSPAAAAESTMKTSNNQGKNMNIFSRTTKKRAGAVGDGSTSSGSKKKKVRTVNEALNFGSKIQACKSGLENYKGLDISAIVSEVIDRRLPVTQSGVANPLRLEKGASQVKAKLRRLLNFISDNCESEEEFRWWSGQVPPLPATASSEQQQERRATVEAIGAAIEKRCLQWVNGDGRGKNKKDVTKENFNAGTLQSRIDASPKAVKDQWIEERTGAINGKRRMTTTEAAAAAAVAIEAEAEEEE